MASDRLGRRGSYRETNGTTQIAHTVFRYNGYLCIQQFFSNSPWNVYKEFIWDPTEPVATRPLAFRQYGKTATFLMHDGNKNVTDVVTVGPANTPVAHYDYTPVSRPSQSQIGACFGRSGFNTIGPWNDYGKKPPRANNEFLLSPTYGCVAKGS
ncbi:MAG: hypothetical protein ACI4QJ_08600 [Candidatus Spyradenecus sp.]